ncbi:MAG: hypothetical protein GYA55_00185 [SAR324 cluster bacterium]|uniref:P-type ATPase A domain-containing protein n=1 Tax=SAR324 cluster bacterium TaxID=2024889 RepID=A0A7X9FNU5_9DELT|nr:hypothetical protein [SAR324 cluster bacterium]
MNGIGSEQMREIALAENTEGRLRILSRIVAFFKRIFSYPFTSSTTDLSSGNRIAVGVFACVNIVLTELVLFKGPEARKSLLVPYVILLLLLLATQLYQSIRQYWRPSLNALKSFRLSAKILRLIAVLSLFMGATQALISTFYLGEGLLHAELAITTIFLLSLVDFLESRILLTFGRDSIYSVSDLAPFSTLASQDEEGFANKGQKISNRIPTEKIEKKMRVALKPGEIVPADSVIVAGHGSFCERRHDFSLSMQFKKAGDRTYAGSRVLEGNFIVQTEATPFNSDIAGYFEQMNASLNGIVPEIEKLRRIEQIAFVLIIFATFGAALYWTGTGASLEKISWVIASGMLASLVVHGLHVIIMGFSAVFSRLAREGIFCGKPLECFSKIGGIKNVVVEYVASRPPGRYAIKNFKVLDERVDEKAMWSLLLSMFCKSKNQMFKDLAEFIAEGKRSLSIQEVSEWEELEDDGLQGKLQDSLFLLGSEEVLLAKGVHFELSDALDSVEGRREKELFVACGKQLLARFAVENPFEIDGKVLNDSLHNLGLRLSLLSKEENPVVDELGKRIGLELSAITGAISDKVFQERLEFLKPCALLVSDENPSQVYEAADLRMTYFNKNKWDFNQSDVVFFSRSLNLIPRLFRLSRLELFARHLILRTSIPLGVVMIVLGLWGLMPPIAIVGALLLWTFIQLGLYSYILTPSDAY